MGLLPNEVVSFFAELFVFQIRYQINEISSYLKDHKSGENHQGDDELQLAAVVLRLAERRQTTYCQRR